MNQQIIQSINPELNAEIIPKTRVYVIFIGYKSSGKTTLIEGLICQQLSRKCEEYKIIKYGHQYKIENKNQISFISTPSLFFQSKEYLKIIDTPGITKIEEVELVLKKITLIVKDYPFILLWVLDYQNMLNYKLPSGLISQGKNYKQEQEIKKKIIYIEVINKIDQRELQDQKINELVEKVANSNIFLFSAKNFYSYQIMNFGTIQQKNIFMQDFYSQNGQYLNLNRSSCSDYCKNNITNNENLVKTENFLQNQIFILAKSLYQHYIQIQLAFKNDFQFQNFNLPKPQKILSGLIKIKQNDFQSTVLTFQLKDQLNLDKNSQNQLQNIDQYFINQSEEILKAIDSIQTIQNAHQKRFIQEIITHIFGIIEGEDDLEIIDEKSVLFQQYLEKQFQKNDKEYEKLVEIQVGQQQQIIQQFTKNLEKYVQNFGILQTICIKYEKLTYPLLFLELEQKISLGTLISILKKAVKQQKNEIDLYLLEEISKYRINQSQIFEMFLKNVSQNFMNLTDQIIQIISGEKNQKLI